MQISFGALISPKWDTKPVFGVVVSLSKLYNSNLISSSSQIKQGKGGSVFSQVTAAS